MKEKISVCITGMGRTGSEIASAILNSEDMKLVMAVSSKNNPYINKDISGLISTSPTGVILKSNDSLSHEINLHKPKVAVDFSSPDAVLSNASLFAERRVNMVIGTTGFKDGDLDYLRGIADIYNIGIVYAPNITLGVNVLMLLANLAASLLEDYDCAVLESHFNMKKDKPSGTAIKIANQVRLGIESRSKKPEEEEEVPIHVIRAGGIVGVHSVLLAGEHDKIEISHESFSRKAFALGALRAVRFIVDKKGFFEMGDVLNLNKVLSNYIDTMASPLETLEN